MPQNLNVVKYRYQAQSIYLRSMYTIDITEDALDDLHLLRKHERERILDQVEQQLVHEPAVETRNRKELRHNDLATWELRVDPFRVFYDIDELNLTVGIVAIGRKEGNRLFVRGVEYLL